MSQHTMMLPQGAMGPARYPHNVNIAFAGDDATPIMDHVREDVRQLDETIRNETERRRIFPYFAAFCVGYLVGKAAAR